ncbi:MAG: hypothetical protein AABZ30_02535 [Myxococcota bacterium]
MAAGVVLALAGAPSIARAMGNDSPVIDSVVVSPSPAFAGGPATVSCSAHDPDGTVLVMRIVVAGGTLPGGGTNEPVAITPGASVAGSIVWQTPAAGTWDVTCRVADNGGIFGGNAWGELTVAVEVVEPQGTPPTIDALTASATAVYPGDPVALEAVASDAEGEPLGYVWSATGGAIAADGAQAVWTAPAEPGAYGVAVSVSDPGGLTATATAAIEVALALPGAPMVADGAFHPLRIAIDPDGHVFVSDPAARAIVELTPRGARLRAIAVDGVPAGVAVDASRRLWVGDLDHLRVVVLDELGLEVGALGMGAGEFVAPLDIALGADGERVYVADGASGLVRAYDAAGAAVLAIPVGGHVAGVAIDDGGLVYATDSRGGTVHVFAADGTRLTTLGGFGSAAGQLTRAAGLAAATDGHLFVVDAFQSRLAAFRELAFAGFVGRYGAEPGALDGPLDVASDPWGRLLVANGSGARIEVLALRGALAPECAGDADCDGMPDAWEVAYGFDPASPADAWQDTDGDGLANVLEYALGTDPLDADTDGDGVDDYAEVLEGSDPLDPSDHGLWADAGEDFETEPARVALDGSRSRNGGAAPALYDWAQLAGPAVSLEAAGTATPWFVGRAAGEYAFRLRVGDGASWSGDATVTVRILDVAPTADAGPAIGATVGERVRLDGRFSTDANGDGLTYAWTQAQGSAVAIDASDEAEAEFEAAETGVYGFDLVVTGGGRASAPARAWAIVDDRFDHVPVAAADAFVAGEAHAPVFLDGQASVDADGDTLTYTWRQIAGAPVALTDADAPIATLTAAAGLYRFELVVSDGAHASVPWEIVLAVRDDASLPSADAGDDRRVEVLDDVTLACGADGASGQARCAWRQVEGVRVALPAGDDARFVPLVAGTYAFELSVSDDAGPGPLDRVTIVADDPQGNTVPTAVATLGPEQLFAGHPVTLKAGDSHDGADADAPLDFTWTQAAGPRAILSPDAHGRVVTAEGAPAGAYAFELRADDGLARSPAARVEYVLPASPPGRRR